MNPENRLSDRDMAIEGYGTDYKGVLPDGTVTGVLSYDGRVFEHYVESGSWNNRHPKWEREYEKTPLRTPLEMMATEITTQAMKTDEEVYKGTYFEGEEMESAGLSGWKYDYHNKMNFRRAVLGDKIHLPAPAVFSSYGNIYIEEGHTDDVLDLYKEWKQSNVAASKSQSTGVN